MEFIDEEERKKQKVSFHYNNREKKFLNNNWKIFAPRGQFHQRVYALLLRPQIPKSAKSCLSLTVFFALLGSAGTKAERKMLEKILPQRGPRDAIVCYKMETMQTIFFAFHSIR